MRCEYCGTEYENIPLNKVCHNCGASLAGAIAAHESDPHRMAREHLAEVWAYYTVLGKPEPVDAVPGALILLIVFVVLVGGTILTALHEAGLF